METPGAHNPNGEDSWGLWQINVNPAVRENHWGDLSDPRVNARAAFELSSGGERMSPWTVTHDSNRGTNRDYRNFLDDASAASGGQYTGDNRGVTGYGGGPGAPGADPNGVGEFAAGGADAPDDGSAAALQTFLDSARGPGRRPVRRGRPRPTPATTNPDAFDCSELVQWAAGRAGIEMPDGSWLQYLEMQEHGGEMTVEEALNTPGALLFSFSSEPTAGSGRPSSAHVAISLGDGTTIEARGRRWGVGEWEAGDRFTHAAVIPGLATSLPPPAPEVPLPPVDTDLDDDLLDDALEMSIGTDPGDGRHRRRRPPRRVRGRHRHRSAEDRTPTPTACPTPTSWPGRRRTRWPPTPTATAPPTASRSPPAPTPSRGSSSPSGTAPPPAPSASGSRPTPTPTA